MNHFIRKIQEGYKSWNSFRNSFADKINLSDLLIDNVDFSGCNLNNVIFDNSAIVNSRFVNSDLTFSSFKNCTINECKFSEPHFKLEEKQFSFMEKEIFDFKIDVDRLPVIQTCNLTLCDFSGSEISNCFFRGSLLSEANFSETNITSCDFYRSYCFRTNFYSAIISKCNFFLADFTESIFVETKFILSNISEARIYGVSTWDMEIDDLSFQNNLSLNQKGASEITVDNIEIGQFIYLLLNNKKIRQIIDTLTSKLVLILGRFTDERKEILDAIKDKLRELNYIPILFDFQKPANRDFIETVSSLAHLSRFVIADFSDSKIVLEEVPHIARAISIPIKPILIINQKIPVTALNLKKFPWFLDIFFYKDRTDLIENFVKEITSQCEKKLK